MIVIWHVKLQIFKFEFVFTIIASKWLKVVDSSLNSLEDRILYMIGGISIGRLYTDVEVSRLIRFG